MVVLAAAGLAGCSRTEASGPRLISDNTVAPDLQALADETWGQFLTAFQARTGCFGNVHLHVDDNLADRAAYDPGTATVTVRAPATAAMLQGALIHEWAHHLEYQCAAQKELRRAFLAAQGLPAETPWRPGEALANTADSAWASFPAEQYAEATIELVLGRRPIPTTARVRPEAVQVIAEWAAGK